MNTSREMDYFMDGNTGKALEPMEDPALAPEEELNPVGSLEELIAAAETAELGTDGSDTILLVDCGRPVFCNIGAVPALVAIVRGEPSDPASAWSCGVSGRPVDGIDWGGIPNGDGGKGEPNPAEEPGNVLPVVKRVEPAGVGPADMGLAKGETLDG